MKEDTDRVTVYIEQMVANLRIPTESDFNFKIFKVADHLRQVKAEDYEPKILSIGPIHRGKAHLLDMEMYKVRYLQQLVERGSGLISIHKLVEKLWEMKEDALKCYPDLNRYPINRDEFVRTLLLDGCFVIELLQKYFDHHISSPDRDPILKSGTLSQIIHDLMLLENQLPFKILNMLFDMTKKTGSDDNICYLVQFLVGDMFQWPKTNSIVLKPEEICRTDHLLGLVYRCYFPFITKTSDKGKVEKGMNSRIHINSASELTEAGIQLNPCEEDNLSFEGGVLKIPSLQRVLCSTESLLRNLMAYEQLCLNENHPKAVTDYVFFVHSLIRSTNDVEILRRSGIISNFLGGDAKVYQMFDGLLTNFLLSSKFCYSDVFERVNVHCGRRREKWMAKLWRDYFNSPWSMIKFLAAVLVLGITIVEVAIAIATFKHSDDVVKVRII